MGVVERSGKECIEFLRLEVSSRGGEEKGSVGRRCPENQTLFFVPFRLSESIWKSPIYSITSGEKKLYFTLNVTRA